MLFVVHPYSTSFFAFLTSPPLPTRLASALFTFRFKSPYECEFKSSCWKNVGENSIHKLTRINDRKRADLIELGEELITDIPDEFRLSDSQRIQVTSAKNNSEYIETSPIIDFLSELTYPLYHQASSPFLSD